MRLIAAFLSMIRLPNLLFIALTQLLFQFCILQKIVVVESGKSVIGDSLLALLILASVLIAAAGNIINDYFDINIDEINKPNKNVVGRIISRRWAMLLHFILSSIALAISFYISWHTGMWYILLANVCCVLLLFFYSLSLKRKLLSGNSIIALLAAWVILILCFSETYPIFNTKTNLSAVANTKLLRLGFLYAGFAFISTLIREAIKDLEDMEGDRKYQCNTMPIAWGVNAAKVYIAVWLIVLLALLAILQIYVVQFSWWLVALYVLFFVTLPFVFIFRKLFAAVQPADFHRLSRYTKLTMLAGILSMIFFYFYL